MRSPNINTDEDSVATVAVNNSGWSSSQAITVEITPNYSNLLEQERSREKKPVRLAAVRYTLELEDGLS